MHRLTRPASALAFLLLLALAAPGSAQVFDPEVTRDVGVVDIITQNDDGSVRETKVWIVLIEGEAFLRTNKSNWLANLRRDPQVKLRVGETVYPVVAEVLSNPMWIERVDAASVEKYGWQEKTIHIFRMNEPTIIRLNPTP